MDEPKNKAKYSTRKRMLDNWLPLGLTVGEIEVVTAGKRCGELWPAQHKPPIHHKYKQYSTGNYKSDITLWWFLWLHHK